MRCFNLMLCLTVASVIGCIQPQAARFDDPRENRIGDPRLVAQSDSLNSNAVSAESASADDSARHPSPTISRDEIPIINVASLWSLPAETREIYFGQQYQLPSPEQQRQLSSRLTLSDASPKELSHRPPMTNHSGSQNNVVRGAGESISTDESAAVDSQFRVQTAAYQDRENAERYDSPPHVMTAGDASEFPFESQEPPPFFATETQQPRQKTATQRLYESTLENEELQSKLIESRRRIEELNTELAHAYQSLVLANQTVEAVNKQLLRIKSVSGRQAQEISELSKLMQENELASLRRLQQLIESVRHQAVQEASTSERLPVPIGARNYAQPTVPSAPPKVTPQTQSPIKLDAGDVPLPAPSTSSPTKD